MTEDQFHFFKETKRMWAWVGHRLFDLTMSDLLYGQRWQLLRTCCQNGKYQTLWAKRNELVVWSYVSMPLLVQPIMFCSRWKRNWLLPMQSYSRKRCCADTKLVKRWVPNVIEIKRCQLKVLPNKGQICRPVLCSNIKDFWCRDKCNMSKLFRTSF